jgi:N utilization substance protein B
MLYQADVAGLGADETLRVHWGREPEPDAAVRAFAERLVRATLADRDALDSLISAVSRNWTIDRIGVVDRNLVRLALAELKTEPDTPPAVVIDEAVEIARAFGESESPSFVHGLVEAGRRRLHEQRPRAAPEGKR